jgi:hypothetical protein
MPFLQLDLHRTENPLDIIERIAAHNHVVRPGRRGRNFDFGRRRLVRVQYRLHLARRGGGTACRLRLRPQGAGGAELNGHQCQTVLASAVRACERYYQAFQFVVWAGQTAPEAIGTVMLETQGRA